MDKSGISLIHPRFGRRKIETISKEGIQKVYPELFKKEDIGNLTLDQLAELTEGILKGVEEKKKVGSSEIDKARRNITTRYSIFWVWDSGKLSTFDIVERKQSDLHPNVILSRFPVEKMRSEYKSQAPVGEFIFNPMSLEPSITYVKEGIRCIRFNQCRPQKWRTTYKLPLPQWENEPPKLFTKLLNHLVLLEEDRKYVIDWMVHALTNRNHSFLHLRGARGNGKTLFMKTIMAVVGHHIEARNGISKDGFNSELRHKRIIGIDDDTFIGTYEGHKLRKRIANTHQTYNEKFLAVTKSEEQYASYIICSNHSTPFYLEYDERRMVIPTLTDVNAKEVLTKGERNFLDGIVKEDEEAYSKKELMYLAKLGHWLLSQIDHLTHDNTMNYQGGTFWEDVVQSLPAFLKLAVTEILTKNNEFIRFSDVEDDFMETKTSFEKGMQWTGFKRKISEFQYKGESLVDWIDEENKTIYLNKKYTPDSIEDDFSGEGEI